MSEQYRCSECGHFVEIPDDAICDVCNIGIMQHLRYTKGGDGSHWDGCEEVHWDCRIAQLEAELARIAELEAERRWIPVGERLPEEKQSVLALDRTGTAYHWEYSKCLSNIFVGYYTHWMPLPKPPEVEK